MWAAKAGKQTLQFHKARVIETDSPTNPGGQRTARCVNDRAEFGRASRKAGRPSRACPAATFRIDVSEVKRFLASQTVRDISR